MQPPKAITMAQSHFQPLDLICSLLLAKPKAIISDSSPSLRTLQTRSEGTCLRTQDKSLFILKIAFRFQFRAMQLARIAKIVALIPQTTITEKLIKNVSWGYSLLPFNLICSPKSYTKV